MSSHLHQLGELTCERGECGSAFATLQVTVGWGDGVMVMLDGDRVKKVYEKVMWDTFLDES